MIDIELQRARSAMAESVTLPIAMWLEALDELEALRQTRLVQQAEQEPLMDYERINALREGEQNGAEDAYFFVRPENDTPTLRKMFCQGFERGFHKGIKYAAPVSIESAVLAEREACAKLCDKYAEESSNPMNFAENCAAAIRARGMDLLTQHSQAIGEYNDYP